MEVTAPADAARFLRAASPMLLADEARHNLILGIASTVLEAPALYAERRFWLVEHDGEVVGAALRTPPHGLVLARPSACGAVDALVDAIDEELPGVVGAQPEVERFARAWTAKTGGTARTRMAHGIYSLDSVNEVDAAPGERRAATPADLDLLIDWFGAFAAETAAALDEKRIEPTIRHRLAPGGGGIELWVDETVVSLAGFGGRTPNGIRIGPVYTPPEHRRHGYASALVAELSAQLLGEGRRFCFLYTDLANPTANRIYERIGYRRVCESAEVAFDR